jgi:hypothetical protein
MLDYTLPKFGRVSINLASVFFRSLTNKVRVECQTKNTRQRSYLSVFLALGKKVSLPSVFSDTRQRASLPSVKKHSQRNYWLSVFLTQDKVNFQSHFQAIKFSNEKVFNYKVT